MWIHKNRKLVLWIAAAILFLGFYWLLFLATMNGAGAVIVEDGQNTFEAQFSHVAAVIPANNDVALQELLDENPSDVFIRIRNASGDQVAEISISGGDIHTNGYTSTENLQEEGGSFDLVPGESYTLEYSASCGETPLENLSFVLYSDQHKLLWVSGVLFLVIALLAFSFAGWLRSGQRKCRYLLLAYIAFLLLFGISSPKMNEQEAERTSFSNAYAVSSRILGREDVDADGYVYVEESGIRSMGYLSYAVPLNRFWSDWESGDLRESGKISSLYQTDGRSNVLTYLDGAVIAAARKAGAPYQLVYLSGKIIHSLLGLLMFALCLHMIAYEKEKQGTRCSSDERGQKEGMLLLVSMLFLSPAMLQGLQSYQGDGFLAAAAVLFGTICLQTGHVSAEYATIAAVSGGMLLCSAVRILMFGGNVLQMAVNSLLENGDRWCLGAAYGFCVNADTLRFPAYLMLVTLLYAGVTFQKQYRERSEGEVGSWEKKGLAVLLLAVLALCLSGVSETGDNGFAVLSGTAGVCFLPLLLIPIYRKNPETECAERPCRGRVVTVFGWFLFLVLYMGMKCVA